jgi:hypothetical protein
MKAESIFTTNGYGCFRMIFSPCNIAPNRASRKWFLSPGGYHTHVKRFKAMYSELQLNPGWTDLDIFKITYDEYMAFSRQYMAGQVASNLLSMAPNSNASSTDPVALFTKLIVESKEKVAPK